MKSLLVDALRRAQGEELEEHAPLPAAEQAADARPAITEPVELNLMQTGALQADSDGVLDGGNESAGTSAETETLPDSPISACTTQMPASMQNARPLSARVGKLAPALCFIAMTASASAYLLINRLAFNGPLDDIGDFANRPRLDIAENGGRDGWRALPASQISVFDRMVLRDAGTAEASKPGIATPVPGSDAVAAVNSKTARAGTESDGGIVTKDVASAEVRDLAFEHVAGGYLAYRDGDYATAAARYRQALLREPNHNDALLGLAAVYQRSGELSLAAGIYQKLLAVDPGNAVAASALLAIRAGQPGSESESDIRHLLQRYPEAHYLHFALGSIQVSHDRWPEARRSFQAASDLKPGDAEYRYNLAVTLERLGETAAARKQYELALRAAENSTRIDRQALAAHIDSLTAEPS